LLFRRGRLMRMNYYTLLAVLLLRIVAMAAGQDTTAPPDTDTGQQPITPPVAFGQEPPAPAVSQSPPLTGLDEASLEPNIAARSFVAPRFSIAEYGDTNSSNQLGGTRSWGGVTHMLGAVDLQRLWSRYETALSYVGSGSFYNQNVSATQVHHLYFDQRFLWRTGVMQFRDVAGYLPEGSFGFSGFSAGGGGTGLGGGGFGGGLGGSAFGGGGRGLGGSTFGAVGNIPRVTNTAILDIQQSLSPRSVVTLAGGYGLLHFTGGTSTLIDTHTVMGQAGYNYALSRRSKLGLLYAYRNYSFPQQGVGSFQSHIVHALYAYQLSGRMSLLLGAGPQIIHQSNAPNTSATSSGYSVSASGQATLRYRFSRATVGLTYDHYAGSGSGFFAGAQTDVVRFNASRQMGRRWNLYGDAGYSHHHRLQQSSLGANASNYSAYFGGLRISRILSRTFSLFALYQYNNTVFNNVVCGVGSASCGRSANRNIAGIGLDWHPQAIRLD
jgi:hypothetical protein